MSFLKSIFEKRKKESKKYGTGHRLGDANEAAAMTSRAAQQQQQQPISLRSNNEAALKAAEAAMQRLQTKNSPRTNTTSLATAKSLTQSELSNEDKELKKALELKEHYFGKPVVI